MNKKIFAAEKLIKNKLNGKVQTVSLVEKTIGMLSCLGKVYINNVCNIDSYEVNDTIRVETAIQKKTAILGKHIIFKYRPKKYSLDQKKIIQQKINEIMDRPQDMLKKLIPLEDLLEEYPDSIKVLRQIIDIYLYNFNFLSDNDKIIAKSLVKQAYTVNPIDAAIVNKAARFYLFENKLRTAKFFFNQLVFLENPASKYFYCLAIEIAIKEQAYDKAREILDKLAQESENKDIFERMTARLNISILKATLFN